MLPTGSDREAKLIRRLERLAHDWPEGYMLASMGGSLCLFRTDDRFTGDRPGDPGLDQDKTLWTTSRIPNTGGDW